MERKKQSMWKTFALAFCLLLSLEAGGCVRQEKKNSEQHVDYSVSFRKALDLQVNQLAKMLETGDLTLYKPVKIR